MSVQPASSRPSTVFVQPKDDDIVLAEFKAQIPGVLHNRDIPSGSRNEDIVDASYYPSELCINHKMLSVHPATLPYPDSIEAACPPNAALLSFFHARPSLAACGVQVLSDFQCKLRSALQQLADIQSQWADRRCRFSLLSCFWSLLGLIFYAFPYGVHYELTALVISLISFTFAIAVLTAIPLVDAQQRKRMQTVAQTILVCGHVVDKSHSMQQEGQQERQERPTVGGGRTWHAQVNFIVDGSPLSQRPITTEFQVSWRLCNAACICPCTWQHHSLPPSVPVSVAMQLYDKLADEPGNPFPGGLPFIELQRHDIAAIALGPPIDKSIIV